MHMNTTSQSYDMIQYPPVPKPTILVYLIFLIWTGRKKNINTEIQHEKQATDILILLDKTSYFFACFQ